MKTTVGWLGGIIVGLFLLTIPANAAVNCDAQPTHPKCGGDGGGGGGEDALALLAHIPAWKDTNGEFMGLSLIQCMG